MPEVSREREASRGDELAADDGPEARLIAGAASHVVLTGGDEGEAEAEAGMHD
jgi:hypothetical protein